MATLQATSIAGTLTVSAPFNYSGSGASLNSIPGTAFVSGAVTSDKIADNTISRSKMGYAGAVLQTIMVRYDPRPGWSTPTSTNGNLVSSMR